MQWIILCWDVLIKPRMICMVVSRNLNSSGRYICEFLKKLLINSKMNYIQVCVWLMKNNTQYSSSRQLKRSTKIFQHETNVILGWLLPKTQFPFSDTLLVIFHIGVCKRVVKTYDMFKSIMYDPTFVQLTCLHFVLAQHSASTWSMMKCCSLVTILS